MGLSTWTPTSTIRPRAPNNVPSLRPDSQDSESLGLELAASRMLASVGRGTPPPSSRMRGRSGATVFTIEDVRVRGVRAVMKQKRLWRWRTKRRERRRLVSICSDCTDAGFNPRGQQTQWAHTAGDSSNSLLLIGQSSISGADYVEVYPTWDHQGFSSHLAAWSLIYLLAGVASAKEQGHKQRMHKPLTHKQREFRAGRHRLRRTRVEPRCEGAGAPHGVRR